MSDKPDTTTDETTDDPGPLRETISRKDETIKQQAERLREQAFQLAGIDTSKGLGKALAAVYDGEPDKDAVLKFAKEEYDFTPGETATTTETTKEPDPAEKLREGDEVLDQVTDSATVIQPEDLNAEIAKAEAEGRYEDSVALKLASMNP